MQNKKILQWDNIPFKTWEYEKQTEMKHKVFSYYLPLWLQILSSNNKNFNYVDGFGGIGAYYTDEDIKKNEYISDCFGSPVISIQTIFDLQKDKKITQATVLIIDEYSDNLENIKKILKFKCLPFLDSDGINFECGDFDEKINEKLDSFEENKNNKLAPTFFF